jgi:tRNA (guanine-N7-)-methyltransferase
VQSVTRAIPSIVLLCSYSENPSIFMAILRVREHVNPLSSKYQTPPSIPDWGTIYAHPNLPLHLDIGCARGRFVLQLAQIEPSWNYLGLEIREPLVDQANQWRTEQGSQNLHYLSCNANNTLRPLLQGLPSGWLQRVTIQFPDPWFKKRHHKRRVVQPGLVQDLADFLSSGAIVFLQSDILEVATEMRDRFSEHSSFEIQNPEWSQENIMPIPTEREIGVLAAGNPVYRAVFSRV